MTIQSHLQLQADPLSPCDTCVFEPQQLSEWQRSLQTRKQQKTEQLLCVFVLIKIRAGLQLLVAVPVLLHPPRSHKSWIEDKITDVRAAAAPTQPLVIAHLQAVISHVICPDSVCLWTSPQSTGHQEDVPGGYTYENIRQQSLNITSVTLSPRRAKSTSSSAQIKLFRKTALLVLAGKPLNLNQLNSDCFTLVLY